MGAVTTALLLATGCMSEAGEPCRIDSDCGSGLICGPRGRCAAPAQVAGEMAKRAAGDAADGSDAADLDGAGPGPDAPAGLPQGEDAPSGDADTAGACTPPAGIFEPGQAPCPEPSLVLPVTSIQIVAEGGLANLAGAGNPLIEKDIAAGTLVMYLYVDGSLEPGCPGARAWMREEKLPEGGTVLVGRNADCTAQHTGTFPMPIPLFGGIATVRQAAYDPLSGLLTGLVDKAEVMARVPEDLKTTASALITLDVDTDDDGTPDMASARLLVLLGK